MCGPGCKLWSHSCFLTLYSWSCPQAARGPTVPIMHCVAFLVLFHRRRQSSKQSYPPQYRYNYILLGEVRIRAKKPLSCVKIERSGWFQCLFIVQKWRIRKRSRCLSIHPSMSLYIYYIYIFTIIHFLQKWWWNILDLDGHGLIILRLISLDRIRMIVDRYSIPSALQITASSISLSGQVRWKLIDWFWFFLHFTFFSFFMFHASTFWMNLLIGSLKVLPRINSRLYDSRFLLAPSSSSSSRRWHAMGLWIMIWMWVFFFPN